MSQIDDIFDHNHKKSTLNRVNIWIYNMYMLLLSIIDIYIYRYMHIYHILYFACSKSCWLRVKMRILSARVIHNDEHPIKIAARRRMWYHRLTLDQSQLYLQHLLHPSSLQLPVPVPSSVAMPMPMSHALHNVSENNKNTKNRNSHEIPNIHKWYNTQYIHTYIYASYTGVCRCNQLFLSPD